MACTQWRKCTFFTQEVLKGPNGTPWDFLKDIDITCCSSGHGQLVFGDAEGRVSLVSRSCEVTTFNAFSSRVTYLALPKQQGILVTIGLDITGSDAQAPLIKVFDLDKQDKGTSLPLCTRISRASPPGCVASAVTCLAVHEGLQHMVLGFQDGTIVLFKGDVTKDRHSKPKVIHEDANPITGLGFKQTAKTLVIFAVTHHHMMSFTLGLKI